MKSWTPTAALDGAAGEVQLDSARRATAMACSIAAVGTLGGGRAEGEHSSLFSCHPAIVPAISTQNFFNQYCFNILQRIELEKSLIDPLV